MTIRFGTSGWRAIIADAFTFDRLGIVVQAIANVLRKENSPSRGIVVGYDTRFLSKAFAEEAARILAANRIPVFLAHRDVPTPCISFSILHRNALGAINISASHNPPEYGGIKFSSSYGGPAGMEVTGKIEEEIRKIQSRRKPFLKNGKGAKISLFDPAPFYLSHLNRILHTRLLKRARLTVVVDCLNGTSRGYLDRFLKNKTSHLYLLRSTLDPTFGGRRPDPAKENLLGLLREVRRRKADLGLATDGDADRFGIVDRGGIFIPPNDVISLVFDYLIETRPLKRSVARTVATTHRLDAIARRHGMDVVETPVGFKYIGEALSRGGCLLGAEESAGLSIAHHVPEKDGILATLLVAEMVAIRRKSLREMLKRLNRTYGAFYSSRTDLSLSGPSKERLLSRLQKNPPDRMGGFKVVNVGRMDGFKFYLEKENWILLRPSGTEPLVRVYLESRSQKTLTKLKQIVERLIHHV